MIAKNSLLGLLCGLVLVAPVAAENRIGILGGVNLATFHETPAEEGLLSTRTLFEAGAVADVGLGGNLSIRFEPMFLVKGSDVSFALFGPPPSAPNGGLRRINLVDLREEPRPLGFALHADTEGRRSWSRTVEAGHENPFAGKARLTCDVTSLKVAARAQFRRPTTLLAVGAGVQLGQRGTSCGTPGR